MVGPLDTCDWERISRYLEYPSASAPKTSLAFTIFEISELRYIETSFSRRAPGSDMSSIMFSRTESFGLIRRV